MAVHNTTEALESELPPLKDYPAILGADKATIAVKTWVSVILSDLAGFFNIGKNMTPAQILTTADMIIERYPHFNLADFKFCFKQAMMQEQVYDRLDGNVIFGWLDSYDRRRNEALLDLLERQDRDTNRTEPSADAIAYCDYVKKVVQRQQNGDATAEAELARIRQYESLKHGKGNVDERQKTIAFKQYYYNHYLKEKKQCK